MPTATGRLKLRLQTISFSWALHLFSGFVCSRLQRFENIVFFFLLPSQSNRRMQTGYHRSRRISFSRVSIFWNKLSCLPQLRRAGSVRGEITTRKVLKPSYPYHGNKTHGTICSEENSHFTTGYAFSFKMRMS